MSRRVGRGRIARNATTSSNRSHALQDEEEFRQRLREEFRQQLQEEEEFMRPVVAAVTNSEPVCSVQPVSEEEPEVASGASPEPVYPVQPAFRPSPFQPAAQLFVALPYQLPSPARCSARPPPPTSSAPAIPYRASFPSPVNCFPPPSPANPSRLPHQSRPPRATFADLPPSYSMTDLQDLPKYCEITYV